MKKFETPFNQQERRYPGKCYLSHRNEPYFYLSPLKLEEIMKNSATINLYHSILSSAQVDAITEYTELMVRIIIAVFENKFTLVLRLNVKVSFIKFNS